MLYFNTSSETAAFSCLHWLEDSVFEENTLNMLAVLFLFRNDGPGMLYLCLKIELRLSCGRISRIFAQPLLRLFFEGSQFETGLWKTAFLTLGCCFKWYLFGKLYLMYTSRITCWSCWLSGLQCKKPELCLDYNCYLGCLGIRAGSYTTEHHLADPHLTAVWILGESQQLPLK